MAVEQIKNLKRRLSLAYQDLDEMPDKHVQRYGFYLEELDLTHNRISDFRFLMDLPRLSTLILDNNGVQSHVKFPVVPTLTTLWLNHNKVNNLGVFVTAISKSFPNLTILSMMNNEAAPSYFNGGSFPQFQDYRHFVITAFPQLVTLDDTSVGREEREEAVRIYGKQHSLVTKDNQHRHRKPRRKKQETAE